MSTLPPPRVAILDDDPSVRTAIARLLRTSEIHVVGCSNGPELLSYMAGHSVDCVLLDLQMPGMNGFEVMSLLDRMNPQVPIVIITAFDEPGTRDACLTAGAVAYLLKPLDGDELVEAIRGAVKRTVGPRST